jgi:hypothetical protein
MLVDFVVLTGAILTLDIVGHGVHRVWRNHRKPHAIPRSELLEPSRERPDSASMHSAHLTNRKLDMM